jgi:tRNA pseudouridine38-40 synthase
LNALLPRDIAILEAAPAPDDFNPRRSLGKVYRYRILNRETRAPLRNRFVWHVRPPLDLERMRTAAVPLIGEHDFAAFRAADCERPTTVRRLTRIEVTARPDGEIEIEVEGTAFLKNMVRIIVGTLAAAGRGKLAPDEVTAIRDGRDRTRAGPTAPPQGLCLVRVLY